MTKVDLGPPKKRGLWIGDGLEGLSDLSDSDEEDEERGEKSKSVVSGWASPPPICDHSFALFNLQLLQYIHRF